jgi:hypothetical protein
MMPCSAGKPSRKPQQPVRWRGRTFSAYSGRIFSFCYKSLTSLLVSTGGARQSRNKFGPTPTLARFPECDYSQEEAVYTQER